MNRVTFWRELYELTDRHNLLNHPFYEAWRNGELTRDDLREYAAEYYHHVASFPGYLRECAATLPDGELRQSILRNLWEEIGMEDSADRAHNLLWLDFAVAAGALAGDVFNRVPIPEIRALINTFNWLAKAEPAQALVAFYVYESQVPRIAREKAQTLQRLYGFDAAACKYFTVHTTADVAHAQVWRDQLDQVLKTDPRAIDGSILAAKFAATALWRALDGIDARRALRSKPPSN
jgi:pyrroloquinoline-quinone synthase